MPNFAYGSRNPFSAGQGAYQQAAQKMSSVTRQGFDLEPNAAYVNWMDFLKPSATGQQNFLSMMQEVHNRYLAQLFQNPTQPLDFPTYLASLNPAQMLAARPPQQRGEDSRRFVGPLRWVGGF